MYNAKIEFFKNKDDLNKNIPLHEAESDFKTFKFIIYFKALWEFLKFAHVHPELEFGKITLKKDKYKWIYCLYRKNNPEDTDDWKVFSTTKEIEITCQ